MKFQKVLNNMLYDTNEFSLEIETDLKDNPLEGLNLIAIQNKDVIINTVIDYNTALELYCELGKYIAEAQVSTIKN